MGYNEIVIISGKSYIWAFPHQIENVLTNRPQRWQEDLKNTI